MGVTLPNTKGNWVRFANFGVLVIISVRWLTSRGRERVSKFFFLTIEAKSSIRNIETHSHMGWEVSCFVKF